MKTHKRILRQLQKNYIKVKEQFIFKTSHLSLGSKIAIFGLGLCTISLFFSWVGSYDEILISGENKIQNVNSFSLIIGSIGYFIGLCIFLSLFSILSTEKRKKIRALSTIYLPTYLICLLNAVIIFLMSIHSAISVNGLQKFSVNVIHGNGIVLCLTGSLIVFLAAYMMKREDTTGGKGSYIHESKDNSSVVNKAPKDNMKLPF